VSTEVDVNLLHRGAISPVLKAIARDRSLVNMDRHVLIASGEICPLPETGKSKRWRSTRLQADERRVGRIRNQTPVKLNLWRRGADPPKDASVITNAISVSVPRERDVRIGNDSCNNATHFLNREHVRLQRVMSATRSRYDFSAPRILSSSL
jgi:hypothetical protein